MTIARVHAGIPTGGQFTATSKPESDIALTELTATRTQPQLAEHAAGDRGARLDVARYPRTGRAIVMNLAYDEDDEVAIAAQAHPSFTARDIEVIFSQREYYREGVLANPNIGQVKADTLSDLVMEGWEAERVVAAANPNLPAEYLEQLAEDTSWIVRGAVAANPAVPAKVVIRLATDEDAAVRIAAGRSRFASDEDAA